MLRHVALSALFLLGLLSGCSAFVRGSVDTQPRVSFTPDAYLDPSAIVKGAPTVYRPGWCANAIDSDLQRLAPLVVQGFQAKRGGGRYDYWSDGIGRPTLTSDGAGVTIDTQSPVIFARVEHCRVDRRELKQLVYAFWYPARPVGSIEKGDIDGGILRITLDDDGEPIVFEYSQPCGCFHGVFVSSALERRAEAAGLPIEINRLFAVERPLAGKGDWVVRGLVEVLPDARPVLYMSAGKHFCEAIRFVGEGELSAIDGAMYELQPYGSLSAAPRGGGGAPGSIFDERGLVIGAKRWQEEIVLSDLEHPGWPRHLDAMLIHWDHDRWTDPTLLQRRLRLPPSRSAARAVSLAQPRSDGLRGVASIGTGRVLLLFANRSCIGCQVVKSEIMNDERVQAALAAWQYRVIETAEHDGATLAAALRVTAVPTLVGFEDGEELFRSEELESPDAVLMSLQRASLAGVIDP